MNSLAQKLAFKSQNQCDSRIWPYTTPSWAVLPKSTQKEKLVTKPAIFQALVRHRSLSTPGRATLQDYGV